MSWSAQALAGWLVSAPAPAPTPASPSPPIQWQAPAAAGCPSEEEIGAAILEASKAPVEPVAAGAVVTFDPERSVYVAELSLRVGAAESKQRFVDARCETVAAAIVLSVAIARDPSALDQAPEEPSAAAPPSEGAEASETERSQPPATDAERAPLRARPRTDTRLLGSCRPRRDPNGVCAGLGLEGAALLGTVVRPSPSVGLRVLLLGARVGVAARGQFAPLVRATSGDVAVDVRTGVVGAEVYPRFLVAESVELRPTVGAALYVHQATGRGFPENQTERQGALRATFGLQAGAVVGAWTLGGRADLHAGRAVAFRGPTGTVARSGPLGLALGAMLERSFGPFVGQK